MNVVLDMDQTLIDNVDEMTIYPRPHLKVFLKYCFNTFETVGIWTLGTRSWFDQANVEVFEPIIKEINNEESTNYKFTFAYTRERSTIKSKFVGGLYFQQFRIKNLKKLWNRKDFPHTRHNTIIVDDNPDVYKYNFGNGVPINGYYWKSSFDRELIDLMFFLNRLQGHFEEHDTILHVEKRYWHAIV